VPFLLVVLLMSLQTTQLYSTMSVYAMAQLGVPERDFGLLYTINGLMVVLLQAAAVQLTRRIGLWRALTIGPLVYAAGYALVGFARGFPSLGMAVAVVTIGELLTEPSEMATAAALGDPQRPGRAMGIFGLVNALGNSLGPFAGGNLYDRTTGRPMLLWGAIAAVGVAGALGYAAVERSAKRR
jgi:predicted MFS family arabinose efflux permease